MQTMSDKVLAIYWFLDDFLRETGQKTENKTYPYPTYRCLDAMVLTTALVAARFFYGNQAAAMRYMAEKQGFVMPEKSAFNRRLHKLADTLEALFYYLAPLFKDLNVDKTYVIDSFAVPVCDNIRITRSRLVKGEDHRGRIASKRRFFYGFQVQMAATANGEPVQYLGAVLDPSGGFRRRDGLANDGLANDGLGSARGQRPVRPQRVRPQRLDRLRLDQLRPGGFLRSM